MPEGLSAAEVGKEIAEHRKQAAAGKETGHRLGSRRPAGTRNAVRPHHAVVSNGVSNHP